MTTHEDVKTWYDKQYTPDARGLPTAFDVRARFAEFYARWYEHLGLESPARVLDVACGGGEFLAVADRDGHQLAGIDISAVTVEQARARLPRAEIRCGTAEALPFESGRFDVVTCLGALEHFLDIPQALAEMRRVGTPDARYFFIVPNRHYLGWWFTSRPGTSQREIREELLPLDGWCALLRGAGLEVASVAADPSPTTWRWVVAPGSPGRKVARGIKALLLRIAPLKYQYQFLILARPFRSPAES